MRFYFLSLLIASVVGVSCAQSSAQYYPAHGQPYLPAQSLPAQSVPIITNQNIGPPTTLTSSESATYFNTPTSNSPTSNASAQCGSDCCSTGVGCRIPAAACGLAGRCGNRCCGRYISFFGGWVRTDEYQGQIINPTPIPPLVSDRSVEFEEGWAAGIALGRDFLNGLRGELEFGYRNNPAEYYSLTQSQGGNPVNQITANLDGHLEAFSVIGNLIYDIRCLKVGRCTPYIGGGVGWGKFYGAFPSGMGIPVIDGNALVYQGLGGVSVSVRPNCELFSEYRYFGSDELPFEGPPGTVSTFHYDSSNIFFGVRLIR